MQNRWPFSRVVDALPPSVPFVPPEALERRIGRALRLRVGANESNFGASPRALAAMREAADDVHWYGDPEGHALRQALANKHGVDSGEVALGSGIDELLGLFVRLFVNPGDPVVTSLGAYPTFNYHVDGYGGGLQCVPYKDDCEDLQGLEEMARRQEPKLVYVANPDNPMGTWHQSEALAALAANLPEQSLLLLDEAYADFAPQEALLRPDVNGACIVHLRTFSKAHGMAGARIGYAIAPRALVEGLDKIRNHFGINRVALAGALASLEDGEYVRSVVAQVEQGKREYARLACSLGTRIVPSATNFVALDAGSGTRARALVAALLDRGIFVRMPSVSPLDRCIRITVGPAPERALLAEELETVWKEV